MERENEATTVEGLFSCRRFGPEETTIEEAVYIQVPKHVQVEDIHLLKLRAYTFHARLEKPVLHCYSALRTAQLLSRFAGKLLSC